MSGTTANPYIETTKVVLNAYSTGKKSKALKDMAARTQEAAEFNANILEGNANEVLETAKINAELNQRNTEVINNVAKFNERLAIKSANRTEEVARQLAAAKEKEGRRLSATQQVQYLASGVGLSGTAQDVMNDSRIENQMDVLNILYNGMREADSILSQAQAIKYKGEVDVYNSKAKTREIIRTAAVDAENLRKEATLNRIKGDVTASSYRAQANAVMLDGVTNTAGQFYDLYQSGAMDSFGDMFSGIGKGNEVSGTTQETISSGGMLS